MSASPYAVQEKFPCNRPIVSAMRRSTRGHSKPPPGYALPIKDDVQQMERVVHWESRNMTCKREGLELPASSP
eukprot:5233528-Amphidinium_carterae.1